MGRLPASLRSLPTTSLGRRLAASVPEGTPTTRVLSITRFGRIVLAPVREYQPVVHRLRLSASP
jgi:hypothetical protein